MSRYVVFLAIASCGCALDLLTKHWVFHWQGMPAHWDSMPADWVGDPSPHLEWWIWGNFAGIQTSLNAGALFGIGHGYSGLFALLSILAAAGIVLWLFRFGAAHELFLTVALACVMAGICGNLYDRLGLWHAPGTPDVWPKLVRDWILLRYHGYTWPNFNIADSLLVCGAGLLLWHGFFLADQRPQTPGVDAHQPPSS
ncbi:MAG: signal peptidase II [Planctomycetota bacterium]|nr:signal peptidase II [Planctomycetota bacterium]